MLTAFSCYRPLGLFDIRQEVFQWLRVCRNDSFLRGPSRIQEMGLQINDHSLSHYCTEIITEDNNYGKHLVSHNRDLYVAAEQSHRLPAHYQVGSLRTCIYVLMC